MRTTNEEINLEQTPCMEHQVLHQVCSVTLKTKKMYRRPAMNTVKIPRKTTLQNYFFFFLSYHINIGDELLMLIDDSERRDYMGCSPERLMDISLMFQEC